jgi:hypothetical protein
MVFGSMVVRRLRELIRRASKRGQGPPQSSEATLLREVALATRYDDALWKVATIGWSKVDASLYLRAFGPEGRFFFGQHSIPAGQREVTAPFDTQRSSTAVPHLSLHESGQVHIKKGNQMVAGPMFIPHLSDLRGQHVATIQIVRFDRLAPSDETPRTSGDRRDIVIPAEPGVESGRHPVYVNGQAESFASGRFPAIRFTLRRETLAQPLYVGFGVYAQKRIDEDDRGSGVILIAGWDPAVVDIDQPGDYLFVVAK